MRGPEGYDRQWRKAEAGAAALFLVALTLAGCTWGRGDPPGERVPHLVWPPPPEVARVELVSTFAAASDLGITRSIWSRIATLLVGGGELRMVRPVGVAAEGMRIAVADPQAGLVHVYDLPRRRALVLTACGEVALDQPIAVAFLDDRLYVSDAPAGHIHVFTTDGDCAGGWDVVPGSRPAGLAVDRMRSRLYVADAGAHQVLAFDPQGALVLHFGSRGSAAGEFNYPTWLAVDAAGNLYVTDALNFRVQVFDPNGAPQGSFGEHGDGSGQLARPNGIGVDRDGHIYLVDALFDAVQLFDREGRYLMVVGARGTQPGEFWLPSGLAVDGDRLYVADSHNRRVQVFKILRGTS